MYPQNKKLQISESVILIHGLARTARSMNKMAKALTQAGYHVVNVSYPSAKYPIEYLADTYIPQALEQCQHSEKIHFVTHSLGGILVRQYLAKHRIDNLGYTVMLAPPNQGSELADKLKPICLYRWTHGYAGQDLGTEPTSTPNRLGELQFPVGVIAGTKSITLFIALLVPRPNDGIVSVESTKIEGMKAHLILPVTHAFLMQNKHVIKQVMCFLSRGEFQSVSIKKP